MSIHLPDSAYWCKTCNQGFIPYEKGLPCPKCKTPEESTGEGYSFIVEIVDSMIKHKEKYKKFMPPAWYMGTLTDYIHSLCLIAFDSSEEYEVSVARAFKRIIQREDVGISPPIREYLQVLLPQIEKRYVDKVFPQVTVPLTEKQKMVVAQLESKSLIGMMHFSDNFALLTKGEYLKLTKKMKELVDKENSMKTFADLMLTCFKVTVNEDGGLSVPESLHSCLPPDGELLVFKTEEMIILSKWINEPCVCTDSECLECLSEDCRDIECSIHSRMAKLARRREILQELSMNPPIKAIRLFRLCRDIEALTDNSTGLGDEPEKPTNLRTYIYNHKCRNQGCGLEYAIYSWKHDWNEEFEPYCPECGKQGSILLKIHTTDNSISSITYDGNIY